MALDFKYSHLRTHVEPQSNYAQEVVAACLREFSERQTYRSLFAAQWEEIAELIAPEYRNTFYFGSYNTPGQKKTYRQIDSNGQVALGRHSAILDSLLTPRNMLWEQLLPAERHFDLMKDRKVRLWLESTTSRLFSERYAATANFAAQNLAVWRMLGAFGTGALFIDELDERRINRRGLRYKAVPIGELFMKANHQGAVDDVIRWFRLTAQQAYQKWGDALPSGLISALQGASQTPFDFFHWVCPRVDYERGSPGKKGKPFASFYVSVTGNTLLEEGGYRTFPYAISRYAQGPGEAYGRSPAMDVLPALKSLNAMKATYLKQAHRAADPVLLTADDLYDFNFRPGSMNAGAVSPDGKLLVHALPTGDFQVMKEAIAEEKSLIDSAFLVDLFRILADPRVLTATQVIEEVNQKGILLAPAAGQQPEYLGPMTDRELDILSYLGMLDPMPEAFKEVRGEYRIEYTSPISRAMKAQQAAGFMRTVETAKEITNITQDPSYLDAFDFDVALPAIAENQAVPESWMASAEKIAAKRQERARAQQQQAEIQSLPAQAAMIKAQAVVAKAQPGLAQPPAAGGPGQ